MTLTSSFYRESETHTQRESLNNMLTVTQSGADSDQFQSQADEWQSLCSSSLGNDAPSEHLTGG